MPCYESRAHEPDAQVYATIDTVCKLCRLLSAEEMEKITPELLTHSLASPNILEFYKKHLLDDYTHASNKKELKFYLSEIRRIGCRLEKKYQFSGGDIGCMLREKQKSRRIVKIEYGGDGD